MAAPAPAIDPTLLVLLSIFGGAALTVIAGFVGAWVQARREHSKWVLERRYEAYRAVLTSLDQATTGRVAREAWELRVPTTDADREAISRGLNAANALLMRSIEEHPERVADIQLVGPVAVVKAVNAEMTDLGRSTDLRADTLRAMQDALGVDVG